MCLVTSRCVPKSNVLVLPYIAFLILLYLKYISSLFLFLEIIFLFSFFFFFK